MTTAPSSSSAPTRVGVVASIARYPVKSMQGEQLSSATFGTRGMEGDRQWGVIDLGSGHVLTGKRTAQLLDASARTTDDGPVVELPDHPPLSPGDDADAALSAWLDRSVSLRRATEAGATFEMSFNVDDEDVDKFEWPTPAGSFLDLAPAHVLTTAALRAAEAAYPDGAWNVHRFRPTILVQTDDGVEGFVENDWVGGQLALGELVLDIAMPTIRCALPTKAQASHGLARDLQIFKTLSARNEQNLGAYANVAAPGTVHVGDEVRVIPTR